MFVNLSDLEAIERIATLMTKRKGKIIIYYADGWNIEYRHSLIFPNHIHPHNVENTSQSPRVTDPGKSLNCPKQKIKKEENERDEADY